MERPLEAYDMRLGTVRGIPRTIRRIGCPPVFPHLSRNFERTFIRFSPRVGKEHFCAAHLGWRLYWKAEATLGLRLGDEQLG
jgi:hypothetical protein